ncbi:voltage-gated potassium channel [Marasmius fiardii PR-910]|nr:voltage-gated potassium channel [Marasmius fiardii PR-910]
MLLPLSFGFALFSRSRKSNDKDLEKDGETATPTNEDHIEDSYEDQELREDDNGDEDHSESGVEAEELERGRKRSWTLSSITLPKLPDRPLWYLKLKAFLFPPTSDAEIESFVPYYRYTPILSGLVIPFSILLEIPGLTEHWYIRTEDNHTVETKPNTMILNVGLGFSMACALVANISLVIRFLEKHVQQMTILCVVALTIHDIINITAVTVFGVEHRFNDGFTYGTSFWMTLCSTIASTITNLSLIVDLVRTPDFSTSGSGLTRKQRSLIIIVILLLCYIAFGALIHCILLHIKFVDALYFTICSIETIGFGDVLPVTTGARVFVCTYATFGVITLALTVATARETVIEALEVGYRRRLEKVHKHHKQFQWKRRVGFRWKKAIEWRLQRANEPIWVRDDPDHNLVWFVRVLDRWDRMWAQERGGGLGVVPHPHGMHLNLEVLTDSQLEEAAMEAGVPLCYLLPSGFWKKRRGISESVGRSKSGMGMGMGMSRGGAADPETLTPDGLRVRQPRGEIDLEEIPLTHARIGRMIGMLGGFALAAGKSEVWKPKETEKGGVKTPQRVPPRPLPRRRSSDTTTTIHGGDEEAERKAFWIRFSVAWMLFIVFWVVGSGIFSATEGWSFGVAMYFCFISFTTIGYGDFSPKTPAGRSVFVVWALFGVATMTILISGISVQSIVCQGLNLPPVFVVVSEAFTSRYKNIFGARIFTRLVERYKAQKEEERKVKRTTSPRRRSTSEHMTTEQLEQLPRKVIQSCHTFRDIVHFFSDEEHKNGHERVPEGLKALLEEIAGNNAKYKTVLNNEILKDKDARHTLFVLSIERELTRIIDAAEEAIASDSSGRAPARTLYHDHDA